MNETGKPRTVTQDIDVAPLTGFCKTMIEALSVETKVRIAETVNAGGRLVLHHGISPVRHTGLLLIDASGKAYEVASIGPSLTL
jgi:hypothetical protein